ncbi:MAG: pseudouridine synthase [Porphyromonas sp.]|nr:pseudouridine synthase [Porphyromonas sp.]
MEEQLSSSDVTLSRDEKRRSDERLQADQSLRTGGTQLRRRRVRIGESVGSGSSAPSAERVPYTMNKKPRTLHVGRASDRVPDRLFEPAPRNSQFDKRGMEPRNGFTERPRSVSLEEGRRGPNFDQETFASYPERSQNTGYHRFQRVNDDHRQASNRPQYPHRPMQRQNVFSASEQQAEPGQEKGMYWQQRPYPKQRQPNNQFNKNNNSKKKTTSKRPSAKVVPVKYEEALVDPNEPIRLNKFLANAGICSRREADELIQKGLIEVNGRVTTELGTRITRQDEVLFQGKPVSIESKVYVLLNKPKNCVTTSDDPQCRLTVMDLVRRACPERIYPVGRLDRNTTGVILITNDGDMAAKLTHPKFKKKKIYQVWLDKDVAIEDMQRIAEGIELEDGEIHADAISYIKAEDQSQVGIEIHSGRNRVVRRIFEHLGYHVVKLDRVYFAGLTKRNLPRGKWRYLNEQEVNNLRMGSFE